MADALEDKLNAVGLASSKPWMKHVGKLKHLHGETLQINSIMEAEFEGTDLEMWR